MDMAELFIDAAAEGVEIGAAHCFGQRLRSFFSSARLLNSRTSDSSSEFFRLSDEDRVRHGFSPIFLEDS
jgi:hypothetical protein